MTLYHKNREYVDEERKNISRLTGDNYKNYVVKMGDSIPSIDSSQQALATDGIDNLVNTFMIEIQKQLTNVHNLEQNPNETYNIQSSSKLVIYYNSICQAYRQITRGQLKALVESKILSLQPYLNDLETLMFSVIKINYQDYITRSEEYDIIEDTTTEEGINRDERRRKQLNKLSSPIALAQMYSGYALVAQMRENITLRKFYPINITDSNFYFNARIKKDFGINKIPEFLVIANKKLLENKQNLDIDRKIATIENERGVKMSEGEKNLYISQVLGQNLFTPVYDSYLKLYLSNDNIRNEVDDEIIENASVAPLPSPPPSSDQQSDQQSEHSELLEPFQVVEQRFRNTSEAPSPPRRNPPRERESNTNPQLKSELQSRLENSINQLDLMINEYRNIRSKDMTKSERDNLKKMVDQKKEYESELRRLNF